MMQKPNRLPTPRLQQILLLFCLISPLLPFHATAGTENTVLIGLNVPLTGPYAKQGEDQLKAYRLAIDLINEQGGILGKRIVYAVRDTKTNAEIARKNALELIDQGAQMITGGSSSSVAIAQSEVCQEKGVPFMASVTHSNATTGKHGHRHTFRWYNNGHQTAKAMAQALVERYGSQASYGFIYADYTWGQTVQHSLEKVILENGGTVVLNHPTELGTKSFVSPLLKAKRANPQVLLFILFGSDMVNALKQATMLKLRERMSIVVPLMELHMAEALGPEVMQGVLTSMCWYHGLSERFAGSRRFVELFEKRYKKKPGNSAATAWVNLFQYSDAVKRAGSFAARDVILELEGHRFTLLGEEEYWRAWDHQGIHPTYIAVGKSPQESTDRWDLFRIIAEKKGENLARTRQENPVELEPLR